MKDFLSFKIYNKGNWFLVNYFSCYRGLCVFVGGVLACVTCQRGWRATVGYMGGMLGWRAKVGGMPGALAWVKWTGGVGGVLKWVALVILAEILGWCLRQYRGWALFRRLFPKTCRKWILFKARKRIQVSGHMHSKHILFFRVSWIFQFKVILRLLPEQIQNSGIFRTQAMLRTLSIYPVKF